MGRDGVTEAISERFGEAVVVPGLVPQTEFLVARDHYVFICSPSFELTRRLSPPSGHLLSLSIYISPGNILSGAWGQDYLGRCGLRK